MKNSVIRGFNYSSDSTDIRAVTIISPFFSRTETVACKFSSGSISKSSTHGIDIAAEFPPPTDITDRVSKAIKFCKSVRDIDVSSALIVLTPLSAVPLLVLPSSTKAQTGFVRGLVKSSTVSLVYPPVSGFWFKYLPTTTQFFNFFLNFPYIHPDFFGFI